MCRADAAAARLLLDPDRRLGAVPGRSGDGVFLLGESWLQVILAALIAMVMAQLGFLSHEAAHREVFASRAWNEWTSRVISGVLMGLSHSWWMAKHNTHHARPNQYEERPRAMEVTIHSISCVASGNCGRVAPRVFRHRAENGDFVELLDPHPPQSEWDAVREAEYLCPSGTIQIGQRPIPQ